MSNSINYKTSSAPGTAVLWREGEVEISISALITLLKVRRRILFGTTFAGGAIAAVIGLLLPNTYTANVLIVPPQKEQSTASAFLGQLGPLAAVAGAEMGLRNPSDLYIGLLGSRSIADHLIEKFELRTVYRTKTATDTRAALKSHSHFSTGKDSLIKVEVVDNMPTRASALANAYSAELDVLVKSLAVSSAGQRRLVMESRLEQEKTAVSKAESLMKNMQQQTGVLQLDQQSTLAIGTLAQLKAQITSMEVALERLKTGATAENPEVLRLTAELNALRTQLRAKETSSPRGNPLLATSALPEAGMAYLQNLRDLKYHETLFELLSKQYEAARLDEARGAPDLQVIDTATVPDKKSGPPRTLITVAGCVLGTAVASAILWFTHTREDTTA